MRSSHSPCVLPDKVCWVHPAQHQLAPVLGIRVPVEPEREDGLLHQTLQGSPQQLVFRTGRKGKKPDKCGQRECVRSCSLRRESDQLLQHQRTLTVAEETEGDGSETEEEETEKD